MEHKKPVQTKDYEQRLSDLSTSTSSRTVKRQTVLTNSRILLGKPSVRLGRSDLTTCSNAIPTAESFRGPIADDDFEVQTAKSEEEKQLALNGRASKLWRLLRIVHRSKFNLFDRLDDGNNIPVLFEDAEAEKESKHGEDETGDQDQSGPKSPERPVVTISEAASIQETTVK